MRRSFGEATTTSKLFLIHRLNQLGDEGRLLIKGFVIKIGRLQNIECLRLLDASLDYGLFQIDDALLGERGRGKYHGVNQEHPGQCCTLYSCHDFLIWSHMILQRNPVDSWPS